MMMKRNLFICETPFQILVALFMIYDSLSTDTNDFVIVDTMVDYKGLAERLSNHPLVNYAYAAETKKKYENYYAKIGMIKDMFYSFPKRWNYDVSWTEYDYIYCRNYTTIITEAAFRYFKRKNSELKLVIMDEGYSSYLSEFWNSYNNISFLHKLSGLILNRQKDYVYRNITEARFFMPELFHVKLPFQTKRILRKNFTLDVVQKAEINQVFCYRENDEVDENTFIFFEECFSFDNGNSNDLQIIEDLARFIGRDRIVIKLHPRSQQDRFSGLGYKVMKKAQYPWEVFAINNEKKKITLLAFSSGALMNYLFFSRSNMKSILLYKMFPDIYEHMMGSEIKQWFEEFANRYKTYISTPSSVEELKELIKTQNEK